MRKGTWLEEDKGQWYGNGGGIRRVGVLLGCMTKGEAEGD